MVSENRLKNKRVLITCGPTWVPIDDFRIISNQSTGKMGYILADKFKQAGCRVTLIKGPLQEKGVHENIRIIDFHFFDELSQILKKELKNNFDIVIHAAAVSDYKLKKPYSKKLKSNQKQLRLELIPTQKIISDIKKWNRKCFLVGFKLESKMTLSQTKKKAADLIKQAQCDLVVCNSVSTNRYSGYIVNRNNRVLDHKNSREELAKSLVKTIKAQL